MKKIISYLCKILIKFRKIKYLYLSDIQKIVGKPICNQPVLMKGKGTIVFGKNVQIGVFASPNFHNSYAYLEARTHQSSIVFGNNIHVNNNFSVESNVQVQINDHVLIGRNCSILDNDGHYLEVDKRNETYLIGERIQIEENVFLGDNVTILKGVTIGKNSVIGNGSIVTKDIPENTIAIGNPAKVIRNL